MSVQRSQIDLAVKALRVAASQKEENTSDLFQDEEFVLVNITLKKIPTHTFVKPKRVLLPHSIHGRDNRDVCVIVKDALKDNLVQALEETPVANIMQVLSLTDLKKQHHQFAQRRDLLKKYSLFLCDDTIVTQLPKTLGSTFFRKKRQPFPVKLSGLGDGASIESKKTALARLAAARDSTYWLLTNGPQVCIKAALTDMADEQVAENIASVVESVVPALPRKWRNVQSIQIKTASSLALPIYMPTIQLPGEQRPASPSQASGAKAKKIAVKKNKASKPQKKQKVAQKNKKAAKKSK
ncbi:MAG: hypothetical protein MHM6MM_003036 [Cercozoa sp. M6MM]